MEKIIAALEDLKNINTTYGIDTEAIYRLQSDIYKAKVCTPIIGMFSSGKSALVNTVLGYSRKILKEDITPETAIPAEILYTDSEDKVTIIRNDETSEHLCVEDYRKYMVDANTVKSVRIQLRNSFLQEIPDVMIVDMPGFESGFEAHNKAIDNYLPQSMAYIVAFCADDMVIRSSIGNILRELCLHDIPLCIVVTKYDKRNDEFEVTFEKLKENLKRFIGDREIRYCRTSSFTGDVGELEDFLKDIQKKSQGILAKKYKSLASSLLENTKNYLITILNGSTLSQSELDEKEEKINKQILSLESKCSKEQEDLDLIIPECVEEIKSDVQRAMGEEESTLVVMALNNQKINDHLNLVVRKALTLSVQKRFIPKIDKYLKNVAKVINSELIDDVNISFTFDIDSLNKGIIGNIVAVVAGLLVEVPILGKIVSIFMKLFDENNRENTKQEIKKKLRTNVFPKVLQKVGKGIEMIITRQIKLINTSIEKELTVQKSTLEKAMADLRQQLNDEKMKKENLIIDIKTDLERIEGIKGGLR
jgi:GTPase SAR1 family protein